MPVLSTVASIHRALAAGFFALVLVELFFAGLVAFGETTSYAHRDLGSLLLLLSAVLTALAVIDRPKAREASLALFLVTLLEAALGVVAEDVGVLGGVHGLVAVLVVYLAWQALRGLPVVPLAD